MAEDNLDDVDWRLLEALQRDGRASYADLGRLVGLSSSAVTERVRRTFHALLASTPEIGEAHHVTGEDCSC